MDRRLDGGVYQTLHVYIEGREYRQEMMKDEVIGSAGDDRSGGSTIPLELGRLARD